MCVCVREKWKVYRILRNLLESSGNNNNRNKFENEPPCLQDGSSPSVAPDGEEVGRENISIQRKYGSFDSSERSIDASTILL